MEISPNFCGLLRIYELYFMIEKWSKAYLVLNAKSIIQIFNKIYAAYRKTAAVAVLKPCTLGGLASKSAQFLYIIQWCNNVFLPEVLRGNIYQALIKTKKIKVKF